jgi:hypothetical protein
VLSGTWVTAHTYRAPLRENQILKRSYHRWNAENTHHLSLNTVPGTGKIGENGQSFEEGCKPFQDQTVGSSTRWLVVGIAIDWVTDRSSQFSLDLAYWFLKRWVYGMPFRALLRGLNVQSGHCNLRQRLIRGRDTVDGESSAHVIRLSEKWDLGSMGRFQETRVKVFPEILERRPAQAASKELVPLEGWRMEVKDIFITKM